MSIEFVWDFERRWSRQGLGVVEEPVIWIEIDGHTVGRIDDFGTTVYWSWGQPPEDVPALIRASGPPKPGCNCATANGGVCYEWQIENQRLVTLKGVGWLMERMNNRPPVPCQTVRPKGKPRDDGYDRLVDHLLAFTEAYIEAHTAKLKRNPLKRPSKQARFKLDNYVPGNLLRLSEHGPWGHVVSVRGQRVEWLQFGQRYPVVIRKSDEHVRIEGADWRSTMRQHSTWGAYRNAAYRAKRDGKGRFVSHKSPKGNSASPLDGRCDSVGEADQECSAGGPGQHVGQPVVDIEDAS